MFQFGKSNSPQQGSASTFTHEREPKNRVNDSDGKMDGLLLQGEGAMSHQEFGNWSHDLEEDISVALWVKVFLVIAF